MVNRIEEVGAELEALSLSDAEVFKDGEVQVVDAWELQRVAGGVGDRTIARADIFRVWIDGQLANNLPVSSAPVL